MEKEKDERFCSTAPDEAASRSSLLERGSRRIQGMKTLLSALILRRAFSGPGREDASKRCPRMSNSLVVQFPTSRWNLHHLESTSAYSSSRTSGSWPKPKRERASERVSECWIRLSNDGIDELRRDKNEFQRKATFPSRRRKNKEREKESKKERAPGLYSRYRSTWL